MNRKKTCGCFSFGKKRKTQNRQNALMNAPPEPMAPQRKESKQPRTTEIFKKLEENSLIELSHVGEQGGLVYLKTKHPLSSIEKIEDSPTTSEQRQKFKYMCPLCLCYFNSILRCEACENYICFLCADDLIDYLKENVNIVPRCPTCCNQDFQIRDVEPDCELRIYSDEQRLSLKNSMRETVISQEDAEFFKTKTGRIDPSIVMKLQVLSDQQFFKTHHAMFRDANNKSPFGDRLRKSIMAFSFQRGSHLYEKQKQNESPEQFKKRYTKTLSDGFKDYFSSNPEGRKDQEDQQLKIEDEVGSEGHISENINQSFDVDVNERELPHEEEKQLPHLRSSNLGQWPKVRESQIIMEEQSLEDLDSRYIRPSEKFQSMSKRNQNQAIEEEKEAVNQELGVSPSSQKEQAKNEEFNNYMQYQQSHSNQFVNLHSGMRVLSADPVLQEVKLPVLLDQN